MDSQQQEAMERYGRGGSRVNASTVIFFPFIEDVPALVENEDCFNPDKADSARKSLPSGHTSLAFAGATYCALYCYYWLSKINSNVSLSLSQEKLFQLPGRSLGLTFLFCWFLPAIYVAISRTQVYLLIKLDLK